jgi:hypothetical protein
MYRRDKIRPQYVYEPLSASRQEFRLLTIFPERNKQGPIFCSLSTYSPEHAPEYEALSYTWGQLGLSEHPISFNGCMLMITSKMWNVLLNLREATQRRVLWIDAICINMANIDERGFQVGAMKHIFAQAQRVVVWLDEPTVAFPVLEDTVRRFSASRGSTEQRLQNVLGTYDLLKDFCKNFSHPWFCRVWTLQEYALAQSVVFLWGDRFLDGVDVVDCVTELWRGLVEGNYTSIVRPEAFEQLREELSGLIYFSWARQKFADGGLDELDFMRILVASQALEATDPRDKIFALLSLAPPAFCEDLSPDYTLSIEEVYCLLSQAMSLATRLSVVFGWITTTCLAEEVTLMPDWMPGWIEDLSLRVSDLAAGQSTTADSTQ